MTTCRESIGFANCGPLRALAGKLNTCHGSSRGPTQCSSGCSRIAFLRLACETFARRLARRPLLQEGPQCRLGLDVASSAVCSLRANGCDHPVAASDSLFENAPSATRRASLCSAFVCQSPCEGSSIARLRCSSLRSKTSEADDVVVNSSSFFTTPDANAMNSLASPTETGPPP